LISFCLGIGSRAQPNSPPDLADPRSSPNAYHQGRWCCGKTPMQVFLDAMPLTKEKMIAA
jgi:hypothetical protein